jgi:hypothetical protein
METDHEKMKAETEADLEEMKATESEAKGVAEHCNCTPCLKATHMLTSCRVRFPLLYTEPLKDRRSRTMDEAGMQR